MNATTKGEACRQAPGSFVPRVDRNRCEGKGVCVAVCPTGVFAVGPLPVAERQGLTLPGRIKGLVHRWQQALLVDPAACEACARCVKACPESAITLQAVVPAPPPRA